MSYPTNNRQNYRMRPNNVPPPTRNPYLSPQELKQKALEYITGQQLFPEKTSDNIKGEMTDSINQDTIPQSMLHHTNNNKERTEEELSPRTNPYDDNRSFPWMNPRGDERLSPSTTKTINNEPAWLNQERIDNEYMDMIRRHPEDVRRIYIEVQKAFDRVDYEGSWIYDMYPDRQTLLRFSEDIYQILVPITEGYDPEADTEVLPEGETRTPGLLPNKTSPRWMLYVIFILAQNELMHRRA